MQRNDREQRTEGRRVADAGRTRGSVTAEFAVLLPVVVLALLAVAGVAVVGAAQVRVQQAAGVVVREAARGAEGVDGDRVAGAGARIALARSGGWAEATVSRSVPLWGVMGPEITVSASAAAKAEKSEP